MNVFTIFKPSTKCDNCGSKNIRYTTNDEIYGKIYGNGGCYLCDMRYTLIGLTNNI